MRLHHRGSLLSPLRAHPMLLPQWETHLTCLSVAGGPTLLSSVLWEEQRAAWSQDIRVCLPRRLVPAKGVVSAHRPPIGLPASPPMGDCLDLSSQIPVAPPCWAQLHSGKGCCLELGPLEHIPSCLRRALGCVAGCVFLWKALEKDQATSLGGSVANGWRRTLGSLGPFIDLHPPIVVES